jgi:hypothetical protein
MSTFLHAIRDNFSLFIQTALQPTTEKRIRPLSELMHSIGQSTVDISVLERSIHSSIPNDPLFPHQPNRSTRSPSGFLCLSPGEVSGREISTVSARNISNFLADFPIDPSAPFYYELEIQSLDVREFSAGFVIDQNVTASQDGIVDYALDFTRHVIHSDAVTIHLDSDFTIDEGDVVGFGYTKKSIIFFRNGSLLPQELHLTSAKRLIPAVSAKGVIQLKFNFGSSPFQTDIHKFRQFIGFIPYQAFSIRVNRTVKPADNFDSAIAAGIPDWSSTHQIGNPRFFPTGVGRSDSFLRPQNVIPSIDSVSHLAPTQNSCFVGQPVRIARLFSQSQGLSFDLRRRMHKIATVIDNSGQLLRIQFVEAWENRLFQCDIDRRFVEPLRPSLSCIRLGFRDLTDFPNFSETEDQPMLRSWRNDRLRSLQCRANAFAIRMLRYFFFCVIDFYRISGQLDQLVAIPNISELFAVLIREVFKTRLATTIKQSWFNIRPTDFLFTAPCDPPITYKVPGNNRVFARYFRGVLFSYCEELSSVIKKLLTIASSRIAESQITPNILLNFTSSGFRFEFFNPSPHTTISATFPRDSLCILPMLNARNLTKAPISIDDTPLADT